MVPKGDGANPMWAEPQLPVVFILMSADTKSSIGVGGVL